MPFPNAGPPAAVPAHMPVSVPGSDFANPKADAVNKKRKKYKMNPSMVGLKAASASKSFLREGKPGAGVGGNL